MLAGLLRGGADCRDRTCTWPRASGGRSSVRRTPRVPAMLAPPAERVNEKPPLAGPTARAVHAVPNTLSSGGCFQAPGQAVPKPRRRLPVLEIRHRVTGAVRGARRRDARRLSRPAPRGMAGGRGGL